MSEASGGGGSRLAGFQREAYALYLAYRDPRVPRRARLILLLLVAYLLSPVDLIPDFVPVLGYLDDLLVVPLGLTLARRLIPPGVLRECREQAAARLGPGAPVLRAAALAVVAIWVALAAVAAVVVWRLI